MANPQDVEILVHIAAPSKASDDARYRSLAAAYLAFQPTKCHNLVEQPRGDKGSCSIPPQNKPDSFSAAPVPQNHRNNSQQMPSFGESFHSLQSFQASFESVIDNANSPLHITRSHRLSQSQSQATPLGSTVCSSWQTPPSIVQDSVPENHATAASLTTPTRVLEHYLQTFGSSPISQQTPPQHTKSQGKENVATSGSPPVESTGKAGREQRQQTIPCTPEIRTPAPLLMNHGKSAPASVAACVEQPPPSTDEEIIEDTILLDHPTTPPAARADSEPPPSKRSKLDKSGRSPGIILRTSSDVGPFRKPDSSARDITFVRSQGLGYRSLELHAPEPEVGTANITSGDLITEGLRKLAADCNISKRYRPASSERELRDFERGYWLVDCQDWPQDLKEETWVFLANYVGAGSAGWGISCRRDEAFSWLRVNCWGVLVGHIYLLIWLASRRRVLYAKATWIDGGGTTVITMNQKEGPWRRQ